MSKNRLLGSVVCTTFAQQLMPSRLSWHIQLVSGLSAQDWWDRFNLHRPVHVGFMMNWMGLGQVFLQVLQFSPVNIVSWMLHTHISFTCCQRNTVFAIDSVIK